MLVYRTIADDSDQLEEHASVKQIMANAEQGRSVTLEQCFEVRETNGHGSKKIYLILMMFISLIEHKDLSLSHLNTSKSYTFLVTKS